MYTYTLIYSTLSNEDEKETIKEQDGDRHLRRTRTANSLFGLTLLLNGDKKNYNIPNTATNQYYGFKVHCFCIHKKPFWRVIWT